ncbi:MAG: DUF1120 domain-containing protein [Pseudomonas mandelii]|jgi:type 1 fimbria pilin|uniref:DUF1120 domain-containing protein n=1 Tax=Pseudomonas mandelii TaxID=75612 RepID=UPI003C75EACE
MIKKYLAALSTTALIGVAPYAVAASSIDLTVTGLITPRACTPSLSDGGTVDVGQVQAKDLNLTSDTIVGSHPIQLTVACDASTPFALNGIDNKAGTSSSNLYFGLGLTSNNEKIGYFTPSIQSALADGQPVHSIRSTDNGASWMRIYQILKDNLTSVSAVGTLTPISVKDLTMELMIYTFIARADSLTLTDDVTIDGSATFEMKYL